MGLEGIACPPQFHGRAGTAKALDAVIVGYPNGNRLTKTLNGTTDTYTYDNGDRLTSTSTKSYTYDAAGRTTSVTSSAGTTNLTYDYEGRVTSITYPSGATNSFTYNCLDTRVGKVDSSGTVEHKRDGVGVTDSVLSDGSASYTPGISQHRSTGTTFEASDRLGSSTKQTNSSQAVTATRTYDAFGMPVSTTGAPQGPFGFAGAYEYEGDSDSSLTLIGFRYYDSTTGRFLTRDPAQAYRNWYCYALNNPTTLVDPSGLKEVHLSLSMAPEEYLSGLNSLFDQFGVGAPKNPKKDWNPVKYPIPGHWPPLYTGPGQPPFMGGGSWRWGDGNGWGGSQGSLPGGGNGAIVYPPGGKMGPYVGTPGGGTVGVGGSSGGWGWGVGRDRNGGVGVTIGGQF